VTVVHAPLAGQVVSLGDVPDPVFAGQVVGAGIAIEPEDGATEVVAVSPIAGRVAKVHPHAFVVVDESGTGVLVHLGIDTVKLKGEGFTLHAAKGDQLELGAPVITFDPSAVRAAGYSAVCPVVVLQSPADSVEPTVPAGSPVRSAAELFSWSPVTGS
jgi:glucose-specific phosphotransferase system IIA component